MDYGLTIAMGTLFLSIQNFIFRIHMFMDRGLNRSFNQYCDLSRQYDPSPDPAVLPDGTVVPPYKGPSVETFIKDFGRDELLDFSKYSVLPS